MRCIGTVALPCIELTVCGLFATLIRIVGDELREPVRNPFAMYWGDVGA